MIPFGIAKTRRSILTKIKKISSIISASLCTAVLLTGCGNSSVKIRTGEISRICEGFTENVEKLRDKEYDNLSFKDTVFIEPKADYVCELTMTPLKGKSTDKIYAFFSEAVDVLTDKKYTDEEKKREIRFIDGMVYKTDEEQEPDPDSSLPYPYNCPDIDKYKTGFETDYPWPTIDNGEYFIDMMYGELRGFDNGALMRYDNDKSSLMSIYFMIKSNSKHKAVFYTEDLTCTDTYRLINGEISIADAAKFAQNYLDNLKITPYDTAVPKPRIAAVNVVDIGGGNYGYSFVTTLEYNGTSFDYRSMEGTDAGAVLRETDYDKRSYDSSTGVVDMIETDKIHHFLNITKGYGITEGEKQTEVITLETAADLVSDFLSGTMKMGVQNVSMVWLQTRTENEFKEETAYPCWKFRLKTGGEIYHTFVDMLTGKIYLYVQAV